jgi:hypothetical protein
MVEQSSLLKFFFLRGVVMSSFLSSLKLVNAKRTTSTDPVITRRTKLCQKIREQVQLATALNAGETFTAKRLRRVRDEAGLSQVVEVSQKVKQWWFVSNDKVCVQLRYGSKVVSLNAKGDKNSVEVANAHEMIDALKKLEQAVIAGELDNQIELASELVRSKFKK